MASELENEIMSVLEQTKKEIQANMEAKRINASGRTSASLMVEKYEGGMRLVGGSNGTHDIADSPSIYGSDTAPIPTLEFGRKDGKVPRGFYYIIREWTKEKGLNFASDNERNRFSYFVARKIAGEGTKKSREHRYDDVYSTPVATASGRIKTILRNSVKGALLAALAGGKVQTLRGAFN